MRRRIGHFLRRGSPARRRVIFVLAAGLAAWQGRTACADTRMPTPAGARCEVEIRPGVPMAFRWIPPTTGPVWKAVSGGADGFLMGSPETEPGRDRMEGPQIRVRIDEGFWLGEVEVTQRQWKAVMGFNPSHFRSAGPDAPVERVSWIDAQAFLRTLNQTVSAPGPEPRRHFRLPTEAEWEYACRAGTNTAFHVGDTLDPTQANFDGRRPLEGGARGEYPGAPLPVGSFPPNAWGLHDMHGNVWEWCEDITLRPLLAGTVKRPPDLPLHVPRIVRGGSWFGSARLCRAAGRSASYRPGHRAINIGFRVLLQEADAALAAGDGEGGAP